MLNRARPFLDIEKISKSALNLLLFSGYLTVSNISYNKDKKAFVGVFAIPNEEIASLYNSIIMHWFEDSIGDDEYDLMLKSLVSGDIKEFEAIFSEFVLKSFSYFDTADDEPEKVYHSFVLGMLIGLGKNYQVKSNRESGHGRYDVMVIPKDKSKLGIVMEFKKPRGRELLKTVAKNALKQIKEKRYDQELKEQGVKDILFLGIGFKKKKVAILAG